MTRSKKTPKIKSRHIVVRSLIVLVSAALGAGIGFAIREAQAAPEAKFVANVDKPTPSPALATPAPGLSAADYSLTIPAQRARQYLSLPVTAEQPIQVADGYRHSLISYQSDGLKIYAQAILPTTPRPAAGYPTMILVHGYVPPDQYDSDEQFYTDFAIAYARKGFLVIKPDLRGFGKSWGNPEGAYYSAAYVADVLNLDASLTKYPEANASDVALLGHSMGGHVALTAALVRPAEFKSLILAASTTGQQTDMYANWTANSDFGSPITLGIRRRVIGLFGEPSTASDFWHQADPYTYLGDLTVPTQIHAAPDDDTVPPRFSADLAAALKAVGRAATVVAYESGGHSFSYDSRDRLVTTSSKFMNDHLNVTSSTK